MKLYDLNDPLNLVYARTRLIGTIVTRKGKAINVMDITEDFTVVYITLSTGTQAHCPWEELDITPVKLGYLNYNRNAHYIFRLPMRRDWKQGLRNTTMSTVKGKNIERIPGRYLAKLIEGSYPKLNKVLEHLCSEKSKVSTMAFSRNFAVNKYMELLYKDKFTVGKLDNDNGTYELDPTFHWVVETLEEDLAA